jgi:hypothetical protein
MMFVVGMRHCFVNRYVELLSASLNSLEHFMPLVESVLVLNGCNPSEEL